MTTQPEALRLADVLDTTADFQMRAREAAIELRRLHAACRELLMAGMLIMDNLDGSAGEVTSGYHEKIIAPLRDAITKYGETV